MEHPSHFPPARPGTALSALLAALIVAGMAVASGCARDLNKRFEFEERRAAEQYRTEGDYDLQNGRLMQALANYTEAVRIWPSDAPAHWAIGRIWFTVQDHDRAARHFALAVACDESYGNRIPEPVPVESPDVMRKLLESRPPPDDANWVADDLR